MSLDVGNTCKVAALLALLAAAPACAQWSDDPAVNLAISDAIGSQNNPHVVVIPEGGYYVSWYSDLATGFDIYLQRLDDNGNELWQHNGVLVADRNFTMVQDYSLAVDSMGRAMLAYRQKDTNGVPQVTLNKINQDGTYAIGPDGATLTSAPGPSGPNVPHVAGTIASMAYVAWMGGDGDGSLYLQRVNAYGLTQWAQPVMETPPTGANYLADLKTVNGGTGVIMSWSAQLGPYDRELWAQSYSYAGDPQWNGGAPVVVYDATDGAMQYGYFPDFIADEAGGAVFVWYTVGLNTATVRVQHLDSSGMPAFAQNGVAVSTDSTRLHGSPDGAYDPATGSIYAVWPDADAGSQSQYSLYAQRVDTSGARLWGPEGKLVQAQSATAVGQPVAQITTGGDLFAGWVTGTFPNDMHGHVARLAAADGHEVWAQPVDFAIGPRTMEDMEAASGAADSVVFVWQSGTSSDDGNILAQNVLANGDLGSDVIFRDGFDGI